jgi:hypothetical protein
MASHDSYESKIEKIDSEIKNPAASTKLDPQISAQTHQGRGWAGKKLLGLPGGGDQKKNVTRMQSNNSVRRKKDRGQNRTMNPVCEQLYGKGRMGLRSQTRPDFLPASPLSCRGDTEIVAGQV